EEAEREGAGEEQAGPPADPLAPVGAQRHLMAQAHHRRLDLLPGPLDLRANLLGGPSSAGFLGVHRPRSICGTGRFGSPSRGCSGLAVNTAALRLISASVSSRTLWPRSFALAR